MKITEIKLGIISVPLRVPFKTALRSVNSVEDVIVEIHTDTGNVGYGEAPPTGVITGDTTGAIIGALKDHIIKTLIGRDIDDFENLMKDLNSCIVKRDAINAIKRGYDTLKVKVGIDPTLDVARLSAIREAVGKDCRIRIDANQAWSPKQAIKLLNQMQDKGLDIELVEQPVKAHDFEGLAYVTKYSNVPVLADESVFSPEDAFKILQMKAADLINIKLMKCGGIYNALKIISMAEIVGVECMIGCMLEAKVSVNAAVHLACAKQIITKIDLDGPVLCSKDPIIGGAVFNEKEIIVSNDFGLGIKGINGIKYID